MAKQVTIFGERCSGTNYLEHLLVTNFEVEYIMGDKHMYEYNGLIPDQSDSVFFFGIARNVVDWVNSLYRDQPHLPSHLCNSIETYLTDPMYSIVDNRETDHNWLTNQRYSNLFELRHVKMQFLVDTMPRLVRHYKLITYDELMADFHGIMNQIKSCGLKVRSSIESQFPVNVAGYRGSKEQTYAETRKDKTNCIDAKLILSKVNPYYEKLLFPSMARCLDECGATDNKH